MPSLTPTVHLMAGLNGAGKTTLARRLEQDLPAVRFSLDEWMLRLYGLPYDDPRYPELSETCKDLIWDTARQVLTTGTDVVLDWNQWSTARRATWAARATAAGCHAVLHFVRVPMGMAIERAQRRRDAGERTSHALSPEGIRHLASIFEEPSTDEGLEVRIVQT